MKVSSRRILSFVLALNGVIAAPLDPRNVEVVTVTEVMTEVVHYTSTLWVDPATPTQGSTPTYGPDPGDEDHGNPNDITTTSSTTTSTPTTTTTTTPTPTTTTPTTPPTTPLTTPTTTSTPTPPPPPPPPPAVKVPTTEVPTTTTPPVYVPTPPPVVPTSTTTPAPPPAVSPPTYGGGGNSPEYYQGEATFYDTDVGSCGEKSAPGDLMVAISHIWMDKKKTANPNKNPFCGQKILISYDNRPEILVTILDTCPGCTEYTLDLSRGAFKAMGGKEDDGRVKIKWRFAQ